MLEKLDEEGEFNCEENACSDIQEAMVRLLHVINLGSAVNVASCARLLS